MWHFGHIASDIIIIIQIVLWEIDLIRPDALLLENGVEGLRKIGLR